MEKIEYDGELYYYTGKTFVDSHFMTVEKVKLDELSKIYFGSKDFQNFSKEEIKDYIKSTKNNQQYYLSLKAALYAMDCYQDDASFVFVVLPIVTSIYRSLNQPQNAIDVAKKYLNICDCGSSILYTSLAAAYCDLENYELALKNAKLAYAKQGGNMGYNNELSAVFGRIKKMSN